VTIFSTLSPRAGVEWLLSLLSALSGLFLSYEVICVICERSSKSSASGLKGMVECWRGWMNARRQNDDQHPMETWDFWREFLRLK
jgi:hypothetical protein